MCRDSLYCFITVFLKTLGEVHHFGSDGIAVQVQS
jgi:hypothetical protein